MSTVVQVGVDCYKWGFFGYWHFLSSNKCRLPASPAFRKSYSFFKVDPSFAVLLMWTANYGLLSSRQQWLRVHLLYKRILFRFFWENQVWWTNIWTAPTANDLSGVRQTLIASADIFTSNLVLLFTKAFVEQRREALSECQGWTLPEQYAVRKKRRKNTGSREDMRDVSDYIHLFALRYSVGHR